MSRDGLQTSNESILEYIKQLQKKKRDGVEQISTDEEMLNEIHIKIEQLKAKAQVMKSSLAKKKVIIERYNKSIQETEAAYIKILENSKTLLSVIKNENQTVIEKNCIFDE